MAALGRTILRSHVSFFAVCVPLLVRLPLKWLLGMVEPPRWFRPYRACSVIQIQAPPTVTAPERELWRKLSEASSFNPRL